MNVLLIVSGVMLGFAAFAALVRIVKGPSHLDRVVAADVLTATVMCWLGVWMVVERTTTLMPVLLALALFAMVGSVSVARFMPRPEDEV